MSVFQTEEMAHGPRGGELAWLIFFVFLHRANFFVFLVETGFHRIGQAGLELLTSSDLPTLAVRAGTSSKVRRRDQPGQHGETPPLLKIQKLARFGATCL